MNSKQVCGLDNIKNTVYGEIGLKHLIKLNNITQHTGISSQKNTRFFLQDLTEYQIVWYTSDLFFCIIYFGAFISSQSVA